MANTIPAVSKAVEVVRRLGDSPAGLTQHQLCTELGVAPSTCYRILQTLVAAGWLRRRSGSRYDLADALLDDCRRLCDYAARFDGAQPILDQLAADTGFLAKLSVRRGDDQITLLRAESPRPVAVSSRLGSRYPVIEGSVGAALLFQLPDARILALIDRCTEPIEEKSHAGVVLTRVEEVRRGGFSFNPGRGRWQAAALSVPVLDDSRQAAGALTLLAHRDELGTPAPEPELVRALKRAAIECAKLLK